MGEMESKLELPRSEHLLEMSFQEALTAAARLVSFVNSLHYTDRSIIQDRQIGMFMQDIVHFALHMRKIGELSELKQTHSNLCLIPIKRGREVSPANLITEPIQEFWKIIDRIIHSQSIVVLATDEAEESAGFESFDCMSDFRGRRIRNCLVRSDRGNAFAVSPERLVLTFVELLLPLVRDQIRESAVKS